MRLTMEALSSTMVPFCITSDCDHVVMTPSYGIIIVILIIINIIKELGGSKVTLKPQVKMCILRQIIIVL